MGSKRKKEEKKWGVGQAAVWAAGSKPNYFHHGQFATIREAILNHFGEALATQQAFVSLTPYQQGSIVEFLKTMRLTASANQ